jgi:pilus assembly protein CpaE
VALKIIVAGNTDRDLEGLVRACGATPVMVPIGELFSLAQGPTIHADILIVDLRGQTSLPPAVGTFRRQHGSVGILIVATTLDPDLIVSAMRAGANEWVAEPITQGELDAAITRIVAHQSSPAVSQTFAFVGVKGGVGTTALAVNVATALARIATSGALMIDLQMARGDAALYLGAEPRFSVADALDNIHKLDDAFFRSLVVRAASRLDVLAAPEAGSATRLDAIRVKQLLEFTAKQFEYIVVDIPRTEPGALEGLDGAKAIVVVTTQELPAVRSAASMATRLRQRYGKDKVLVVMTRLDKDSEISHQDVEHVLGSSVAFTFPSDYRTTMAALNKGRPVVLDNHSALASSFEKFARLVAGVQVQTTATASRGGWLDRITGRK